MLSTPLTNTPADDVCVRTLQEEMLDVFRLDPEYEKNELLWAQIRKEILGDDAESSSSDGSGSGSDDDGEDESEDEAPAANTAVEDKTEVDVVTLRRTIYLTIMSALDFEETCHKLMKLNIPEGSEMELVNMVLECCSQVRWWPSPSLHVSGCVCCATIVAPRGVAVAECRCQYACATWTFLSPVVTGPTHWMRAGEDIRATLRPHRPATVHDHEAVPGRVFGVVPPAVPDHPPLGDQQAAQRRQVLWAPSDDGRAAVDRVRDHSAEPGGDDVVVAHFHQDPVPGGWCARRVGKCPWVVVTSACGRGGVQELSENMGLKKLRDRFVDPMYAESMAGLFPRDVPKNTRFAINFFTSIGLGALTYALARALASADACGCCPPPWLFERSA